MSIIGNIRDDLRYCAGAVRSLRQLLPIARQPSRIFPDVIDELADRFGEAPALLSARENFSYRTLAVRTNAYARWALGQGLAKGGTVCLLMPNRPEYLAIWLGIGKVGGITALLNTNLTGPSLAHCIDIVAPRHIIVAAELFGVLAAIRPQLACAPQIWVHGEHAGEAARIDPLIEGLPGGPLTPSERRPLTIDDRALYVYTSGTTGMPKAANITHHRVMLASYGFAGVMNTRMSDRMYDCLPMYHTAGGLCAIGSLLVAGGSVVIGEKFSAREFWRDVAQHGCTLVQYIGELCRYLLNTPPGPDESRHRIRLACGNGLRPDIWTQFQRRFRIPRIVEFYAATEGNVLLFNFEGRPGAVGRLPRVLARRFPVRIVAVDLAMQEPVRDAQGLCVPCAPGEAGEAIGRIAKNPAERGARFDGYADTAENEPKILRNAFEPGDAWFRTGDLMRQDARGYFYFVDRLGDTFRWKGENVATAEVAEALCGCAGVLHASVYGVAVPRHDGRAGMAAIAAAPGLDLAALRAHVVERLPAYARPLFVRRCAAIDVTATFKQKKGELVRAGFDPAATSDALYFDDRARGAYVPLDAGLYERICSGKVRL